LGDLSQLESVVRVHARTVTPSRLSCESPIC
jgi:hypothetical protein